LCILGESSILIETGTLVELKQWMKIVFGDSRQRYLEVLISPVKATKPVNSN